MSLFQNHLPLLHHFVYPQHVSQQQQQQSPLSYSTSPSFPSHAPTTPAFSPSTYSELHPFPMPQNPPPQAPPPAPAPASSPDPPTQPEPKRPSGACTRCKKMKMKCEFQPDQSACHRCKTGGFPCVVEGRKPRTPSQREWLLAQIRQKDAYIARLLKEYHPAQATPLALASAKLALPSADRALHRDALAWAEKGVPAAAAAAAGATTTSSSATAAAQRWRARYRDPRPRHGHNPFPPPPRQRRTPDDDDSAAGDSDWDSSDYDSDADDASAEEAAAAGFFPGMRVYAHALPEARAPLGLIARLSLEQDDADGVGVAAAGRKRARDDDDAEDEDDAAGADADGVDQWGVANKKYFQPGPSANVALRRVLNEREKPPAIIASGLITWSEAVKLFDVFFQYINPYVSVLDPYLHTASSVFERCPFLFTVVCAIALRYHAPRPGLHRIAMHFAKAAAAMALVDGVKSVELVQAYFLLSVYGDPARRWEEDRSWFYGGLATRIAVDLGLNKTSGLTTRTVSERHARELRNRVRTWINCFNLDRASSTQWGKPSWIHDEDVVRAGKEWYGAKYSHPYDIHLVMYTELLRIMSRFHAQIYAGGTLNKNCDFRALTEATEAELRVWHDEITWRYENESDPNDPGSVFRTKGVPMFENYMRLVMYSFGFQDAWRRRNVEPGDMFFAKCMQAASAVIRHLVDVVAPGGYLKYAPDCYFVIGGFSSAFLLKLLRPEFRTLLDPAQRMRILALVSSLADVLASPAVAIDEGHTPKLYSRFLRGMVQQAEKAEREMEEREEGKVAPTAAAASSSSSLVAEREEKPTQLPSVVKMQQRTVSPSPLPPSPSPPHTLSPSSSQIFTSPQHALTSSPTHTFASSMPPSPLPPRPAYNAFLALSKSPSPLPLQDLQSPLLGGGYVSSLSPSSGSSTAVPTPRSGPGSSSGEDGEGDMDATDAGWSEDGNGGGGGKGAQIRMGMGMDASYGMGMGMGIGTGFLGEEEYLATMQGVTNDGWLDTMLMPGFKETMGGSVNGFGGGGGGAMTTTTTAPPATTAMGGWMPWGSVGDGDGEWAIVEKH